MPIVGEPPRLSVPTSTLWPPSTNTLGRSAMALTALATGPAATVRYCPAGTLDSENRPASSVRALMPVLCTATRTAPAGRPEGGMIGWGWTCGCVCAPGAVGALWPSGWAGNGIPRMQLPHTTRPVTVPVADWAVAACVASSNTAVAPHADRTYRRRSSLTETSTSWYENGREGAGVPRSP